MKILLLELSCSDSVSKNPSRYGGAGITFRRLAENIDNCYFAAERFCFENDLNDKCIPLATEQINWIRYGQNLNDYPQLRGFDLYVYCNPSIVLNTEKPQACWGVGQSENIHPEIKHLLLHDPKCQSPILGCQNTKIHEFVLGIDIPPFQYYNKSDCIVQISNHYPQINSIILAQWALKHKIKTIFAGPISDQYPLLDYIDYNTTFYLGQIKQEEKIKLLKMAKCAAALYSFPINGPPLFCKEALSYGCWFLSSPIPSMAKTIRKGVNGFLIRNEQEFLDAWNNRDNPDQLECWNTARQWSVDNMINSFIIVTDKIINGS